MSRMIKSRRRLLAGAVALALAVLGFGTVSSALAAGPPVAGQLWASQVDPRSGTLSAEVNPNGSATGGYFEYTTQAEYEAHGFSGARRVTLSVIGIEAETIPVNFPTIVGLAPDTTYRYRLFLSNEKGQLTTPSAAPYPFFVTSPIASGPFLPDGRGWELVSPVEKNGGFIAAPESIAEGAELQAGSQGGTVTYSSASSFAGGAGAPPASQYLSTRTVGGWSTQNITVPIFSGSYDAEKGGAPYRLFSPDLAHGLLLNGKGCRGEATGCPVPNPTLPGSDAPSGYQDYYLRDTATGGFAALVGPTATGLSGQSASQFEVALAGASPDLGHVILSSCAKLTASATSGCPGKANLYEYSVGALTQVNAAPGATLAAQGAGAVSVDGSRVYFYEGGNLSLRDGSTLKQVDAAAGGGGTFELATSDGSIVYFMKGGNLYRFGVAAGTATKITSTGDVAGVLGAAADGSNLYYLRSGGLYRCEAAAAAAANGCDGATKIAAAADASDYPPTTGTARVSEDGTKLLFMSTTPLPDRYGNTYDNTDLGSGEPDSEVYLYAAATGLTCVSCNPTNGRPTGPSSIPGAIKNGAGWRAYKPRVLSTDGARVFFDSRDAISPSDTNTTGTAGGGGVADVYQWEAAGEGSCARAAGCASLLSLGRDAIPSTFVDASANGSDAFFLTGSSLVPADPGATDIYDARIGGGFGEPPVAIPCEGDSCQVLPPEAKQPTLTTLLNGPGNPAVHYNRYGTKATKTCPKGKVPEVVKTKGGKKIKKCVKRKRKSR